MCAQGESRVLEGISSAPDTVLKLGFADGLQKLCEWGNFLLCLQIFNIYSSSALIFSLQRELLLGFSSPFYMVTISY